MTPSPYCTTKALSKDFFVGKILTYFAYGWMNKVLNYTLCFNREALDETVPVVTVLDPDFNPVLGNTRPSLLDVYKLNEAYNCPTMYEGKCLTGMLFTNQSRGTIQKEEGVCRSFDLSFFFLLAVSVIVLIFRWDFSIPPKKNVFIQFSLREINVRFPHTFQL